MSEHVTFRRIRGRVVPIKTKKGGPGIKRRSSKGGGSLGGSAAKGGGIGAAIGAGFGVISSLTGGSRAEIAVGAVRVGIFGAGVGAVSHLLKNQKKKRRK